MGLPQNPERGSIAEAPACGKPKPTSAPTEPTAITKFQEIRKLDELAKKLHAEMERRGLSVDVTPEKKGG